MASSTLSLDSLNSPSPSPSPLPASKKHLPATANFTTYNDLPTGPSLDIDSEFTELTEDNQDGTASTDGHVNTAPTSNRNAESTSKRGGCRAKYDLLGLSTEEDVTTGSPPVEEEMAGLPCAAEEEEDDEDDSENPDDSAGLDDEDGGFVNPRSLDLYVTQRLPGIQSTYATSGRAKYTKSSAMP